MYAPITSEKWSFVARSETYKKIHPNRVNFHKMFQA